jgi:hypothetical protein
MHEYRSELRIQLDHPHRVGPDRHAPDNSPNTGLVNGVVNDGVAREG